MGWNRPTSNTVDATSSSHPSGRGKMPRLRRGLIAGAIVVLGAGLAAWILTNGEAASSPLQKKDRGLIKEVTPAAAPKAAPIKVSQADVLRRRYPGLKIPDGWDKPYPPDAYYPDGRLRVHSRWVKSITNAVYTAYKSWEDEVFPEGGPNVEIASILTMEPGETLIGEIVEDENFTREFLKSLATPVIASADDPDDVKALKKAVNETRIELKARHDAGEDIAKIMADTKRELQELWLYREEVGDMVAKAQFDANGELSDADTEDLYKAANMMLEGRGVKPLDMPSFLKHSIEVEHARNQDAGEREVE